MLHELKIPNEARATADDMFSAIPDEVLNMRHGLYAFLFINPNEKPIWDNNVGREKIVVPATGGSVKPGKFEQTFRGRFSIYAKHLHSLDEVQNKVFNLHDCLLGGVVLNLSDVRIAGQLAARIFEEYWIAKVRLFVEDEMERLPNSAKGRLEWLHTAVHSDPQRVREKLMLHMTDAAGRIQLMLKHG